MVKSTKTFYVEIYQWESYFVIADSMEEALSIIREKYPDKKIMKIAQSNNNVLYRTTKTITVEV